MNASIFNDGNEYKLDIVCRHNGKKFDAGYGQWIVATIEKAAEAGILNLIGREAKEDSEIEIFCNGKPTECMSAPHAVRIHGKLYDTFRVRSLEDDDRIYCFEEVKS